LIDNEDLDILINLGYRWSACYQKKIDGYYAQASVYIGAGKNNITYYMHKLLLNNDGRKYVVHHKNHNTLDNRKENIEIVEFAKNVQQRKGANKNNKTNVRNVVYYHNKIKVEIMKNGIIYRKYFNNQEFDSAVNYATEKRNELFGTST
jgi:hypothetical protein